jgi:ligand-binding sensor domain-containing protein/two-component sensor histidine kinase
MAVMMPTTREIKSQEKVFHIFVFVLLLFPIGLSAQNPYIQHYTTYDGLPTNTVYYIYQDSKKFIWFATDAGVVRYDGTSFRNYRKNDGLSSNEIIRIKEDSSGRIWFFNINGRLNFMYQDRIYNNTNASFLDSIKNKKLFINFYEDQDRKIFFYNTWFEIYSLDVQNRVRKYSIEEGRVRDLSAKKKKELLLRYLCRNTKGEFILWGGYLLFKLNPLFRDPVKISDSVYAWKVFPRRNNSFYISAYKLGIFMYDDKFMIESTIVPFKMPINYTGLEAILEDNGGLLWIVTFDRGVYCLRNKKIVQHFDIKEGQSIIQDNEGNIWISSMKDGVYKISPYLNDHRHYENSVFRNMGITALDARHGKGLWLTNGRSVYLLLNNEFYTFNYQMKDFPASEVFQLKDNTLFLGAKGSCYYAFTGIEMNYFKKQITYKSSGRTIYSAKEVVLNKGEDKINSFGGSTVCIYNIQNYFSQYKVIDIGERINNTFYNLNNDLIINANRMYIIRNDSIIPYRKLSVFDYKIINDHIILNDSTELYNIEGDCIYLNDNRKFINLTATFTSPIDLTVRKAVYEAPTLYLSTFRNIYLCNNVLQAFDNKPVNLQLVDLNFRNIHDMAVKNDSLYIASDDGLTIIPEPMIGKIKTNVPIPYIQSILVNDIETDRSKQSITLTGKNRIRFIVSSINYSSTPVNYSYILEGADHEWVNGTGRVIVYQDLPVGNYVFKLRTSKPNSIWSKTLEYKIMIKAYFWQLPVFYIFLSLFFTGLIALIIIRRKNIQIKRRELDHQLITLEQKALQSMMNPHFIFNSLGSIQNYLLQKKPGEAGLYLSQFARLIRQNLNAINAASINLEEEIDRLKNYLDLEQMRMENKFEYLIEVDDNLPADEVEIPSMIIQPFVENAIWHGIAAIECNGRINIRFRIQDEKSIIVIIEDNGIGIKHSDVHPAKPEKHLHLGMEMTRKRLELLGKKFSIRTKIEFFEAYPGKTNPGTRVEVVLPVSA